MIRATSDFGRRAQHSLSKQYFLSNLAHESVEVIFWKTEAAIAALYWTLVPKTGGYVCKEGRHVICDTRIFPRWPYKA